MIWKRMASRLVSKIANNGGGALGDGVDARRVRDDSPMP